MGATDDKDGIGEIQLRMTEPLRLPTTAVLGVGGDPLRLLMSDGLVQHCEMTSPREFIVSRPTLLELR